MVAVLEPRYLHDSDRKPSQSSPEADEAVPKVQPIGGQKERKR